MQQFMLDPDCLTAAHSADSKKSAVALLCSCPTVKLQSQRHSAAFNCIASEFGSAVVGFEILAKTDAILSLHWFMMLS